MEIPSVLGDFNFIVSVLDFETPVTQLLKFGATRAKRRTATPYTSIYTLARLLAK